MMKRITLLLGIVMTISMSTHAQTTAIPDANFEQALIDQGIDTDATLNGTIATADAAAFTGQLVIETKGISDLTGIAAFANLTDLRCRFNSIVRRV